MGLCQKKNKAVGKVCRAEEALKDAVVQNSCNNSIVKRFNCDASLNSISVSVESQWQFEGQVYV